MACLALGESSTTKVRMRLPASLFCVVPCSCDLWLFMSGLDNLVTEGVSNQFGDRVQSQFVHDVGAVCFGRLDADAQRCGNLLVAFPFGQQLHNLPLTLRQPAARRFLLVTARISLQVPMQ